MSKRLIGLCHPVRILALLHGVSGVIRCIEQLCSEALRHALLPTNAGVLNNPTQRQSEATLGSNFYWHLIRSTTNSPRLYLKNGHDILHGLLENVERVLTRLFLNDF